MFAVFCDVQYKAVFCIKRTEGVLLRLLFSQCVEENVVDANWAADLVSIWMVTCLRTVGICLF